MTLFQFYCKLLSINFAILSLRYIIEKAITIVSYHSLLQIDRLDFMASYIKLNIATFIIIILADIFFIARDIGKVDWLENLASIVAYFFITYIAGLTLGRFDAEFDRIGAFGTIEEILHFMPAVNALYFLFRLTATGSLLFGLLFPVIGIISSLFEKPEEKASESEN